MQQPRYIATWILMLTMNVGEDKPRGFGILGLLLIPLVCAAACGYLFFRFGGMWELGGIKGAGAGAVAGFVGSCILLFFEWLNRISN